MDDTYALIGHVPELDHGSPWLHLEQGLSAAGMRRVAPPDSRGRQRTAGALISFGHPRWPHSRALSTVALDRRVLIVLEPDVTSPLTYRVARKRYRWIFAASPLWAAKMHSESFTWPQVLGPALAVHPSARFAATMINANKRSAVSTSLYGLRRRVLHGADRAGLPIGVFGAGWRDQPVKQVLEGTKATLRALEGARVPDPREAFGGSAFRPIHWQGAASTKAEAFAQAPTTVVIENSPDYVSEKLVDAVRHGVVPIYVGPDLDRFGLPHDIAIPASPRPESVLEAVALGLGDEGERVRDTGRRWLESTDAHEHEEGNILLALGESVGRRLMGTA